MIRPLIVALMMIATTAMAADKPALTNQQVLEMLVAHKSLDGRTIAGVLVPWEFKSANLRMRLVSNQERLEAVEKLIIASRAKIEAEVLVNTAPDKDGRKPTRVLDGTPEAVPFLKQFNELLEAPVVTPLDLARIKVSELKMDVNDIPPSVVKALRPILDDDVTPKDVAPK